MGEILPLVSWLIPMYNNNDSARRAIDSMLNQTYQNFEIIIVLDPSKEETNRLCEEYETRDNRVRVLKNETRLGIAGSLNKGLEFCKGKYIARMDADDYSYPERLEKQVKYMEQHPEIGLLGGNMQNIVEETKESYYAYSEIPDSEEIKAKLLFGNCIMHPTILFRAEIKEKYQYPEMPAEDYAFYIELLPTIKMAILPDVILDYSVHQDSATYSDLKRAISASIKISREALRRMFEFDTAEYEDSLFGWRIYEDVSDDIKGFLLKHYRLICQIIEKNKQQKKIECKALYKALNQEWRTSLQMAKPCNQLSILNKPVECLIKDEIEKAFLALEDDSRYTYKEKKFKNAEKIIVYGIGGFCKEFFTDEKELLGKVVAFCDTNADKQGGNYLGKEILSPKQLKNVEFDIIGIASPIYEEEIKKILSDSEIPEEKIVSLGLWKAMRYYRKNSDM